MSYTQPTFLQQLRNEGLGLLHARVNYFAGKRPTKEDLDKLPWPLGRWALNPSWAVARHVPKGVLWGRSTHKNATKAHRVRYQLIATHVSGEVVKLTIWRCGGRCTSEIRIVQKKSTAWTREECWTCSKI